MGKDHSTYSIKRRNTNKIKMKRFILFVEGRNTEYSYFKQLKKSNCKVEPVPVRGKGISRCVDFVNDSIRRFVNLPKKERDKYTEKWLVFDYDGHEDFRDAILLARSKGYEVAFSSMCIEYWFLLHFADHDGNPIPLKGTSHSQAQIDLINKHIVKYNKTRPKNQSVNPYDNSRKEIEDDFFDLMLSVDTTNGRRRIVNALERAKSIHELKKAHGTEFSESVTTIYDLLLRLGVFDFDTENNEFTLYFK